MSLLRLTALRSLFLFLLAGCSGEARVNIEELEKKLGSEKADDRWSAFVELRKTPPVGHRLRDWARSDNRHLRNGAARLQALEGLKVDQLCARLKSIFEQSQGQWDAFLWQAAGLLKDYPAGVGFQDFRRALESQGAGFLSEEPETDWGRISCFDLTPLLGVDLSSVRCVLRVRDRSKEDRVEERNVALVGTDAQDWKSIVALKGLGFLAQIDSSDKVAGTRKPGNVQRRCEVYCESAYGGLSRGNPILEIPTRYRVKLDYESDRAYATGGKVRIQTTIGGSFRSAFGPFEGWASLGSLDPARTHGQPELFGPNEIIRPLPN